MIDLRSDTVTLPSPKMREIMASAEVGDDVYGEDPSINRLERLAAERMGKEAAMYVPSGTMGNLCASLAHTTPGQEMICGAQSHTFMAEAGGAARIGGLSIRTIAQQTAALDPAQVEAAIRPRDVHYPPTGLIWVEQPSRGYVLPLDNLAQIASIGARHGIPVHMDGARIFNAATYLEIPAREIAAHVDSVMFCVSKGLAAPVGSLLAGSDSFIERARSARKLVGGSMRQAGVVAAAGAFALETSVDRLREDHENALRLAAGLRWLPGLQVDRDEIQTNIFFVDVVSDALTAAEFVAALAQRGVRLNPPRGTSRTVRFVANAGVTTADIDDTLAIVTQVLAEAEAERGRHEPAVPQADVA